MEYSFQYENEEERMDFLNIHKDKFLIRIKNITEGNFLVFSDYPRYSTDEEISTLKQENLSLQLALAESIEKQEIDKVNDQVALAELVETLIIKGVL